MNDDHPRILNFNDRLAIDRAVKDLAKARNAQEQDRMARKLAQRGRPALNALLRHLDASDPALRGGLGRLAQHLEPEMTIAALRRAAMDESRSDAARLTAVMLLERYLGQEIDPALAQRIPASYDVARESGEEAIAIAETEPLVLVEYAEQLLDEPPEIVHAVVQVIKDMDDPRRARLLMAVAAYAHPSLQQEIIQALGSMRDPLALDALHTLWHLTTPQLRPQIQRQLQKLRMAGVRQQATATLRGLWSPVNAQGHSFLWLIREQDAGQADLLVLILHDELGIVYAAAYPDLDGSELPPRAAQGTVHQVRMVDSHHQVLLVELNPSLALTILDEAIETLSALEVPWPGELVVFGHWLWSGRAIPPEPASWPHLPAPQPLTDEEEARALLDHPIFAGWVWLLPEFDDLLRRHRHQETEFRKHGVVHQQVIRQLLEEDNRLLLSNRLLMQARWLKLARETKTAAQVLAIREAVESGQEDHPFITMLAWRSLLTAAADRAMRHAMRLLDN